MTHVVVSACRAKGIPVLGNSAVAGGQTKAPTKNLVAGGQTKARRKKTRINKETRA